VSYLTIHTNRVLSRGRRTTVWDVRSRSRGDLLGRVQWYGPWRQYTFWPEAGVIFNPGCLDEITAFCRAETAGRLRASRRRRSTRDAS
jgi:hypothetical protein